MERLSEAEVEARLKGIPEWSREERFIVRRYGFGAFRDSVGFVNRVADIAEEMNHHPLIAIDYRHVTLRLTTWRQGGLTQADFDLARRADSVWKT